MSVCDVPVISNVCDAVGEGAASLVTAPFEWLAQAMGAAAKWLFEAVWNVFDATTLVDVTSTEYVHVYNILFGVAVFIFLIFFCLQLITGLIHRDPAALSRAALGLAKSVLGSFLVLTVTGLLLEVTDQLAVGIVQATGNTMEGMGDRIALLAAGLTTINIASPGVGVILTIFLAGLAISAAAIVWFSLLIRKALLLVAIVFGPIALAGATWDATKGWFGKWATFVIALICSKLVLVVIFLVAINQVSSPIDADLASISDPIAGVVLMFVAAFAPYLTYKFISFMGFDMYHAMSSEQEAKAALNRPIPIPSASSVGTAKKILDTGGADSGGGGSAPAGPSTNSAASQRAGTSTTGDGPNDGSAFTTGGPQAAGAGGETSMSRGTGVGASTGSEAGAGSGAAGAGAAAGPVGVAAVAGATIVKGAATAGPKLGSTVGDTAEGHAGAAAEPTASPPTPSTAATPPPAVPPAASASPTPGPSPRQPAPLPAPRPDTSGEE